MTSAMRWCWGMTMVMETIWLGLTTVMWLRSESLLPTIVFCIGLGFIMNVVVAMHWWNYRFLHHLERSGTNDLYWELRRKKAKLDTLRLEYDLLRGMATSVDAATELVEGAADVFWRTYVQENNALQRQLRPILQILPKIYRKAVETEFRSAV